MENVGCGSIAEVNTRLCLMSAYGGIADIHTRRNVSQYFLGKKGGVGWHPFCARGWCFYIATWPLSDDRIFGNGDDSYKRISPTQPWQMTVIGGRW